MRQEHDPQSRVVRRHVGHMLVGPGEPDNSCVPVARAGGRHCYQVVVIPTGPGYRRVIATRDPCHCDRSDEDG
jgi:hypothetical protein